MSEEIYFGNFEEMAERREPLTPLPGEGPIELNANNVTEALKAAVALNGEDYVYPAESGGRCDYVRDGKPSCIVGHVLVGAGVEMWRLEAADNNFGGAGTPANDLLRQLEDEEVLTYNAEALALLTKAQREQDLERPWGESLNRALKALAELNGDYGTWS